TISTLKFPLYGYIPQNPICELSHLSSTYYKICQMTKKTYSPKLQKTNLFFAPVIDQLCVFISYIFQLEERSCYTMGFQANTNLEGIERSYLIVYAYRDLGTNKPILSIYKKAPCRKSSVLA
ncbi:hypothetical protein MKX01_034182, partial [Papaver californicum]